MGIRVNRPGVILAAAAIAAALFAVIPATGAETVMCPPVTISSLTTPETVPPTIPPDTTLPETTVAEAPTTTSAPDSTTSTSLPDESSTTAPTTSTVPETTSPPEATTTTVPPEPPCNAPFVYDLVFPIYGQGSNISPFGAPRDGGARLHLGNDLAAPKLQPVVAAASGTVTVVSDDTGISGYRVHIRHDDGWSTLYIHLNNDTAGTDDGAGIGIRPGLRVGDRIEAGDLIGWNGDSGNAEDTVPHVHFELRDPDGVSVDPEESLAAAERIGPEDLSGPFLESTPTLELLLTMGVPVWCEDDFATACPQEPATTGAISQWLSSAVGPVDAASGLTAIGIAPPLADCGDDCPFVASQLCEGEGCEQVGVTALGLAQTIAWDVMRDRFIGEVPPEERTSLDGAWRTPRVEPPALPSEISPVTAHGLIAGPARCLPAPDDQFILTRAEAADLMLLYLGWDQSSLCPNFAPKR